MNFTPVNCELIGFMSGVHQPGSSLQACSCNFVKLLIKNTGLSFINDKRVISSYKYMGEVILEKNSFHGEIKNKVSPEIPKSDFFFSSLLNEQMMKVTS